MVSKMLSNIIDNLQIEISNICVRYEDKLSNPKMPFSLGVSISNLRTFTANTKWEKEFITKKDICNKALQLQNFSIFLNFRDDIFYDKIMDDFKVDHLDPHLKDEYNKGSKSNKNIREIVKYKHFISQKFQANLKNFFLLQNFCIEAHVKLNKNPKENNLPQIELDLVFGGEFEKGSSKVANTKGQTFALQFQQQQLIAVLKFLEYSGYYTKYQTFVLKDLRDNKFTDGTGAQKNQAEEYINLYTTFRYHKDINKDKNAKKMLEESQEKLKEYEKDYDYPTIAPLRQVAFNKHMVEKKKEEDRANIDKKVKEAKESKKGVMGGVKGFFGFSNSKKDAQDKEEIRKLQADLDNEFLKKYEVEEDKLNKEIEEFLDNKGSFDPDVVEEMSEEWTRFKFTLTVPETKFALLKKDSTPSKINKIVELQIVKITSEASLGRIFEDINLSVQEFHIMDYITTQDSKPAYMMKSLPIEKGNNAIGVRVSHNSKEEVPVKIAAINQADFFVFVNIPCIKEIENCLPFFNEDQNNKIDISYYAEQAKIQFLKYLNRGIDYVETIDLEKVKTMNIEMNISLSSPTVFLKDPRAHIDRWIILNLGKISMGTEFVEKKQIVDGQEKSIDIPVYGIGVDGFKLTTAINMGDYNDWESSDTTDIIQKVSLMTKVTYAPLELDSLAPTLDINLEVSNVNVLLSDFLVLTVVELLFGIQEAYNTYSDQSIGGGGEIEETKIDMPYEEN